MAWQQVHIEPISSRRSELGMTGAFLALFLTWVAYITPIPCAHAAVPVPAAEEAHNDCCRHPQKHDSQFQCPLICQALPSSVAVLPSSPTSETLLSATCSPASEQVLTGPEPPPPRAA